MTKISLPYIPNNKVLEMSWVEISHQINKTDTARFISDVKNLALAMGEINKSYSKKLPESYLFDLWRKMTKLRRLVKSINAHRRHQNKKDVIPISMLDYWFGCEENDKYRRQAGG